MIRLWGVVLGSQKHWVKRVRSWKVEAPLSRNYIKREGEQGRTWEGSMGSKASFILLNGKDNIFINETDPVLGRGGENEFDCKGMYTSSLH